MRREFAALTKFAINLAVFRPSTSLILVDYVLNFFAVRRSVHGITIFRVESPCIVYTNFL